MKGGGRLSEFHPCVTDTSASFQRGTAASSGLLAIQESWKVGVGFLALPLAVGSSPSLLLEPGWWGCAAAGSLQIISVAGHLGWCLSDRVV